MEDKSRETEYKKSATIWQEVITRFTLPLKPFNWSFFGYLIGVIILIGGLGVWVSFYSVMKSPVDDGHNAAVSLGTFFIALWATSYLDIVLMVDIRNKLALIIYNFLFFALAMLLLWLIYEFSTSNWAFLPAILGFFLSITSWYLANAANEKFDEKTYAEKLRLESNTKHGQSW